MSLGAIWMLAGMLIGLFWLLDRPRIEISWQTETELNSIGFNILRSDDVQGPYQKKNDKLIPASEDAIAGADYSYLDTTVQRGKSYYYQLEDIDQSGNTTRHSPISFEAPGRPVWIMALSLLAVVTGLMLMVSAQRTEIHDSR